MPYWYLYYRIMRAVPDGKARIELQDVLVILLSKCEEEWPRAARQELQDWFEYISRNADLLTPDQLLWLTKMEPWAVERVPHASGL